MSKNEKLFALVAGGVILYELWKRNQAAIAAGSSSSIVAVDTASPVPVWAQQLAAVDTGGNVISTMMEDTVTTLMNLPQGPGGSYVNYSGNPGLFGTNCLLGQ